MAAKTVQYLLTNQEMTELHELLTHHDALSRQVSDLDNALTTAHEDDDDAYDSEEDPEMRKAIRAVQKARVAINKWCEKHLNPERDLYDREADSFPAAPLLRLSDAGEQLELPSYDTDFGDEIETEPNLSDILDPPERLETLRYIAKHGAPKLTPESKRAARKLMDQCLALYETIKRVAG
jgi:hypothetical protein